MRYANFENDELGKWPSRVHEMHGVSPIDRIDAVLRRFAPVIDQVSVHIAPEVDHRGVDAASCVTTVVFREGWPVASRVTMKLQDASLHRCRRAIERRLLVREVIGGRS